MQNKRSREQWNKTLDSHMWELEDIEKGLMAQLLLSYYELSSTMRRCFSSCAVFAKDYHFSRDQLVLHWIAQGYIESKANMELEDIAEEYFEKLAMRSFFQDFWYDRDNDDKIKSCKMHDIVHDFAQFMSKNESFKLLVIYTYKFLKKCNALNPSIMRNVYALSFFFRMTWIMSLRCSYQTHSIILNVYEH